MLKFLTAALVAGTIVSARPAAAAPPPLEVYGQVPNIEQVAISPDGRSITMIWTNGEQRTVVVRSLTDVQNGVSAQRYWTKFMGANDPQDPVLADISPALHADKVSAPVLLIHGKDDTVVPLEQSRMMADALKRAGKPVEFTTLDGTDHQLTRGDTRLATLKATIAFLEKNNPPN